MRKRYKDRLTELRDVLQHLGHEQAAFRAYMQDERQKLADGSIQREVYDKVLNDERSKVLGTVASERLKLKEREQKINDTAKEEVYEKVLGKERAALEREGRKLAEERQKIESAERAIPILQATEAHILKMSELIDRQIEAAYGMLPEQKTQGFPWLAKAYDDLLSLQEQALADILLIKESPAPRAADAVRDVSRLRRAAERKAKVLEYQLRYYEALFPWLTELTGEGVDDLLIAVNEEKSDEESEPGDPARHWLTDAEYASLSTADKYQLALDRYWRGRRTKWQIGRDYERYVGYLYEKEGFHVYYQGIVEGLEDLGRDLVVTKERVQVIQCKNWSADKQIHEKHVNQLFGTITAYQIDHRDDRREVVGVLYTSTILSPRAIEFASKLGIKYVEQFKLQPYPAIKCNVSRRDSSKIYHLPFDQQYDRTVIEEERLECYVETVAEAEALGFRRAFRWRGNETSP